MKKLFSIILVLAVLVVGGACTSTGDVKYPSEAAIVKDINSRAEAYTALSFDQKVVHTYPTEIEDEYQIYIYGLTTAKDEVVGEYETAQIILYLQKGTKITFDRIVFIDEDSFNEAIKEGDKFFG